MKRVIVESPYAGNVERNVRHARACMKDSLMRGEAPFLSHLLYPQVLDDLDPGERSIGIWAGLAWGDAADLTAVYIDLGESHGMAQSILRAYAVRRPVERRTVPHWEATTGRDILPRGWPIVKVWR